MSTRGSVYLYYNVSTRTQNISNTFQDIDSSIVSFAMARVWPPFWYDRPEVTECSMRWCAQTIQNVTVTNGTFNLGTVETHDLTPINNTFEKRGDRDWNSFNVTSESAAFPGNRTFSVSPADNREIKNFMVTVFSSRIDDPFGLALLDSRNLSQILSRISTTMTYALGQGRSGATVDGQVITTEQYVVVNWPWIILPLTEVVMAIAFLLCTLIHTWRCGVTSWKASGIVPLLTVMEGWSNDDLRATSWRETEKRSERMRGVLVPNEDGMQQFKRMDT
jgi:hypothetical protein